MAQIFQILSDVHISMGFTLTRQAPETQNMSQ